MGIDLFDVDTKPCYIDIISIEIEIDLDLSYQSKVLSQSERDTS